MRLASSPVLPLGSVRLGPRIIAVSAISADVVSLDATNDIPGTPVAGNIVFAHVVVAAPASNPTVTPPLGEGWALVTSGYDSTGLDTQAAVYWKRWGAGGQTDNITVTFSASAGAPRLVLLLVERALASGTPYSAAAALVGSSLAMTALAIAPSVLVPDRGLLLRFFEASAGVISFGTLSEPAVYDGSGYAWTAGTDGAVAASARAAPPGTVESATALASTGATNGWAGIALALAGDTDTPTAEFSAISPNVASPDATNTVPGTPAPDDIIIAHVAVAGHNGVVVTPPGGEGWQEAAFIETQSGTNSALSIWWKRWGEGGQIDNTTVTFSATAGTMRIVLGRVTGAVPSGAPFAPAGVGVQCDDASNDMGATTPTAAVARAQSVVLRFYAASGADIVLDAPMVALYEGADYAFEAGADGAMGASYLRTRSAGTAPLRSASATAATVGGWVGITVVLPPY